MITHHKSFIDTPFSIDVEMVNNQPGTWQSSKVIIYHGDNLIGEYLRNYNNFAAMTFQPFKIAEEWFALYSANYTTTRVMKLYEDHIEDWCGEDPTSSGFCPVEIYVPRFKKINSTFKHDGKDIVIDTCYVDCDYKSEEEFIKESQEDGIKVVSQFCNFGFLCGCIWGDDSSWKIRFIDLSQILNKKLIIEERFGYWEMPSNLSLRDCIDMTAWELDEPIIRLIKAQYFNIGKRT